MANTSDQAVPYRVEPSEGHSVDLSNLATSRNTVTSRETQDELRTGEYAPSLWHPIQRLVIGVTIVAGFVGIYSIWPATESKLDSRRALELDQWQAEKEFIDYCVSNDYASPSCDNLETTSIDPPPNFANHEKNPGTSTLSILLVTLSIVWLVYFIISPFLIRKWLHWRSPKPTDREHAASGLVQYLQSKHINYDRIWNAGTADPRNLPRVVEINHSELENSDRHRSCNTSLRVRKRVRFDIDKGSLGNRNGNLQNHAVDECEEIFELDGSKPLPSLNNSSQRPEKDRMPSEINTYHDGGPGYQNILPDDHTIKLDDAGKSVVFSPLRATLARYEISSLINTGDSRTVLPKTTNKQDQAQLSALTFSFPLSSPTESISTGPKKNRERFLLSQPRPIFDQTIRYHQTNCLGGLTETSCDHDWTSHLDPALLKDSHYPTPAPIGEATRSIGPSYRDINTENQHLGTDLFDPCDCFPNPHDSASNLRQKEENAFLKSWLDSLYDPILAHSVLAGGDFSSSDLNMETESPYLRDDFPGSYNPTAETSAARQDLWKAKHRGSYDDKISVVMPNAFFPVGVLQNRDELLESWLKRQQSPDMYPSTHHKVLDQITHKKFNRAFPKSFSLKEKIEILESFLERRRGGANHNHPETIPSPRTPLAAYTSSRDIPIVGGLICRKTRSRL